MRCIVSFLQGLTDIIVASNGVGVPHIFVIGGNEHHQQLRIKRPQLNRQLDTVHFGHFDVQQRQLKGILPRKRQRLLRAFKLCDHLKLRYLRAVPHEALKHQRLIIDQYRSHWIPPLTVWTP